MRDPNRIDPLINILRRIMKASPDLRLGQIMVGAAQNYGLVGSDNFDVFHIEDDEMQKALLEFEQLILTEG